MLLSWSLTKCKQAGRQSQSPSLEETRMGPPVRPVEEEVRSTCNKLRLCKTAISLFHTRFDSAALHSERADSAAGIDLGQVLGGGARPPPRRLPKT